MAQRDKDEKAQNILGRTTGRITAFRNYTEKMARGETVPKTPVSNPTPNLVKRARDKLEDEPWQPGAHRELAAALVIPINLAEKCIAKISAEQANAAAAQTKLPASTASTPS